MATIIKKFEDGTEVSLLHADAVSAGFGHKKITIELEYKGVKKSFSKTTSNMPDFDDAMDLEGEEKYEAFYNIIAYGEIEEQIHDWAFEVDEASND